MMAEQPLVSIIIPTRNCASTIERCLESVRAQTYPHIEIIVVDNHSHDGTAKIAAQYAQVLQAGPERSAQVNQGARHARGAYLYRIDGDFKLDPDVVTACVQAMQARDLDAVAVPNVSRGESYWARVRALERDTYLDDSLIIAARFFKRSAFLAVGGFDESLVACEDYDLHNRLLQQGYRVGHLGDFRPGDDPPVEIHLGEADSLWAYARQSFYYGPSVARYLGKHPQRGGRQMFPLRPAYLRHWPTLRRQPRLLAGLVLLKAVQYAAAAAGMLAQALGLTDERGRWMPNGLGALALILIALWGLAGALARLDVYANALSQALLWVGGVGLWQVVGRRRAQRDQIPLSKALPKAALAFSPLLITLITGFPEESGVTPDSWLFLLSLGTAGSAGWLTYLAEPALDRRSKLARWGPAALVAAGVLGFVVVTSLHSLALLRSLALGAYDLAVYDQALWASAQGQSSSGGLSDLLHSSISGQSVLADKAAPILGLFWPAYRLGVGGPALLLISQNLALGLAALALYRLGRARLGRAPAALLASAYLVHFVTLRIAAGSFHPLALAVPLLLFALDAYRRRRWGRYYLLLVLALACGLDVGPAVAGLGLYLAWFERDRQPGLTTLGLGLSWTLVAAAAFLPFFGGTSGQVLASYTPPPGRTLLDQIAHNLVRAESWRYLASLLIPLGLTPVLGLPLLLPTLPRLLLNLLAPNPRYTSLNGWYEFTLLPFLFVAALQGVRRLSRAIQLPRPNHLRLAACVASLVASLTASTALAPDLAQNLRDLQATAHQRQGQEILEQIPQSASVAAQSPFGIPLAHRQQLTILPQVEEADFVLLDRFHPNRDPQPQMYRAVLQRLLHNPDYGLRTANNGYLLFERGLDPQNKLKELALVSDPQIEYARTVELAGAVAYLGFDLSQTQVAPGEPVYVTHYWQSLVPVQKPYLFFSAYPGARRFEEIAFGLLPVNRWQPGDVVRHEQAITLPPLPDGDEYEIAVGLWHDQGELALTNPEQLLGNDVVRIATISARDGRYQIKPWSWSAPGDGQ